MTRGRGAPAAPTVMIDELLGRVEVRVDHHSPSVRLLEVNGRTYGAIDLDDPRRLRLSYLTQMRVVVDTVLPAGPSRIVHLGGGAFALPRALAARRPELEQVVIERSAQMIALAEQQLGLRRSPALSVVHDDARAALAAMGSGSADAVVGDAFVGRDVPRHLATAEFVGEVARVLRSRGVYVVNLIDAPPWSVLPAHAATVHTVLRHLVAAGMPAVAHMRDSGNLALVASRRPLHRTTLEQRLARHRIALVPGGRLDALVRDARPHHDADG